MPDASHLLLFMAAGWLLNLTPGPDVLYIVTHSLRSGWRTGLVAGLGITMGCFVHVFAAAAGLGALLVASATAFTIVKWIGACYLFWIGLRGIFKPSAGSKNEYVERARALPATGLRAVFLGGFWTNVLNPKVVIFFLAFLPQFIDASAPNKTMAFLLLGVLFNVNSIPVNAAWAGAAAWVARREVVQQGMNWLDKLAGAMFIAFGVRLAITERPAG